MSEREEQFFERAERVLLSLEKSKTWYKSMSITFAISAFVCVFSAGAVGYKFGLMQTDIEGKASIDSVKMLKNSTESLSEVMGKLIDDPAHKDIAKELIAKYKIMNDNIFMFTTTRSAETYNPKR